jgi:hypothetical protein
MTTDFTFTISEVTKISFGTLDIDPAGFAQVLQKYVHEGSKRHRLSKDDIHVYANITEDFEGKEKIEIQRFSTKEVAKTLKGLLAAGAKFMDAVFWLAIPEAERPEPEEHPAAHAGHKQTFSVYNNHQDIARCMFFYFFYILTRARAPVINTGSAAQPVPQFLNKVLGISKGENEVADYLASFSLENIDPSWVRYIDLGGLSQESLNRFGLGVAGYRLAAPFKMVVPDGPDVTKYKIAIDIATSIAKSPADWDFHPSTRTADVLTLYGNINKNLSNLILRVYKKETIEEMVKVRILFAYPTFDAGHRNFERWSADMSYKPGARIFRK